MEGDKEGDRDYVVVEVVDNKVGPDCKIAGGQERHMKSRDDVWADMLSDAGNGDGTTLAGFLFLFLLLYLPLHHQTSARCTSTDTTLN